ncbi:MAG: 16S rRNA (cytosine(1402)-N(4))-methyltransferase RsmH [Candidatus Colwellbacteria bacterium]|nr:16S rRNA (cytosine(1402)-N(4))-methyltransferase RsmH [Candidatus Colwellbacteria bacterium]
MHEPVLLNKVLEILSPLSGKFVIDGTVDGGGHALEIIKRIGLNGMFLGVEWDNDLLERFKARLKEESCSVKVVLVNDNYSNLPEILKRKKLGKADALLLDLGFSSNQLEYSGKGFSFLKDEPLIMRYSENSGPTAAEVLNSYNEKELTEIFHKYGEERYSNSIAKSIIRTRKIKKIITTFDLVKAVVSGVPSSYARGRINPATKVFQAIRVYINSELENLESILKNLEDIVKPGGVAIFIAFHSLEDRLIKNYLKNMKNSGVVEIILKKPVIPEQEEISSNPRSRSAKLRIAILK